MRSTTDTPQTQADLDAFSLIAQRSFNLTARTCDLLFERSGRDNLRLLRDDDADGTILAGLMLIPMGQSFGGRNVPTTGIALVGVEPWRRNAGVGRRLMRETLTELRGSGWPLSTLYPATINFYRKLGYGIAGSRFKAEVALDTLNPTFPDAAEIRPITPADRDTVHDLYLRYALRQPGYLIRNDYCWIRIESASQGSAHGYLVTVDGQPEGYLYVHARADDDLYLSDVVTHHPDAARALLAFLAGHRSVSRNAVWFTHAVDPLLAMLDERRRTQLHLSDPWMIRLLDVPRALETRGYPHAVRAEVTMAVQDPLFPENDGVFTLNIDGGRGHVTPGGAPSIELSIRGLAALYTGHHTPHQLISLGLARPTTQSTNANFNALGVLFSGPAPAMSDRF